ncbi:hypothetical protein D3C75_972630 [compost metagenome]
MMTNRLSSTTFSCSRSVFLRSSGVTSLPTSIFSSIWSSLEPLNRLRRLHFWAPTRTFLWQNLAAPRISTGLKNETRCTAISHQNGSCNVLVSAAASGDVPVMAAWELRESAKSSRNEVAAKNRLATSANAQALTRLVVRLLYSNKRPRARSREAFKVSAALLT